MGNCFLKKKKKSENLTGRALEERNRERIEPRRSFIFTLGACGNNDGTYIYIYPPFSNPFIDSLLAYIKTRE